MTDISINYKKFDFHPGMRPLVGEYTKTIITVVGPGRIGKSTICDVLMGPRVNYISTDAICIQTDHNIVPVLEFLSEWGSDARFRLDVLAQIIIDKCLEPFMDYLFKNYIEENENMNILFEGYLLSFPEVCDIFISKCTEKGYRVWKMERG